MTPPPKGECYEARESPSSGFRFLFPVSCDEFDAEARMVMKSLQPVDPKAKTRN